MASKNAAISITLNLDGSGFSSGISKAASAVTSFNQTINAMILQVDGAGGKLDSFQGSLAGIAAGAYLAEQAFSAFKSAVIDLPQTILETNSNLQKMQTVLQGLSKETTAAGKESEAQKNVAWLQDLAENAPYKIQTLQDAFIKLKSVGIDPTAGALNGLVDAAAAAGASDQQLEHASLAIQEMAGRGVISLEQLRRQLGRAIPTAMSDMAYSLGMSYGQMVTAVQKGTLEANSALTKLSDQWERTFGGQAIAHMQNFYGEVNVFETEWTKLQQVVGDAGFMDAVQAALQKVIDLMKEPVVKQWAADYGNALGQTTNEIVSFLPTLINMRSQILQIGEAFLIAFAADKGAMLMKATFAMFGEGYGAIKNFVTVLSAELVPAMTSARTLMTFWSASGPGIATAIGTISLSVRALGLAFLNMVPIVGQIIAVIYSLVTAFGLFDDKVKEAKKNVDDGFITQQAVDTLNQRKAEILKSLDELKDKSDPDYSNVGLEGMFAQVPSDAREKLEAELAQIQTSITKGEASIAQAQTDAAVKGQEQVSNARLKAVQDSFNQFDARMKELFNAPENQDKATQATLNDWRIQGIKDRWAQELAIDQEGVAQALKMSQSQADGEKAVGLELLDYYNKKTAADEAYAKSQIATAESAVQTVAKTKDALTPIEREIEHMQEIYAEATAKMADGGTNLAKVKTQLAQGYFKEKTDQEVASLLKEAAAADTATAAAKAYEEAKTKAATAMSDLTNKSQDATVKLAELNAQLMAGDKTKDPAGIRALDASLQDLRAKIAPTVQDMTKVDKMIKQIHDDSVNANVDSQIIALREKTQKLQEELGNTKNDNYQQQANDEIAAAQRVLSQSTAIGDERMAQEKAVQDYIQAVRDETDRKSENSLQTLSRQWADAYKDLGDASKNWANDAMNQFENFVKTGKFDMASLVEDILADFAKIQMEKALSPLLGALGNAVAGAFGSGGGGGTGTSALTDALTGLAGTHHTGGIIGANAGPAKRIDMSVFSGAPRFHTGGIIGDTLDSSEMPIIAQKGEGVFTQAQMQAMGTAMNGQSVAVQVNVINQSGTTVNAQQQGQGRFDGKQLILDIVLTAASQPGQFRNSLKGALQS